FEEICHSEFINTWAHLFTETNITADGTNCVRSKSIFSDSGTLPPESCIFGQLLNLAALFLAVTVYLRHRQIVEFYWHRLKQVGRWRITSCILLWIGYFSAFGVSVVGNFQENNVIIVHYAGALLAFGCGLIYTWAQTVFSYNMNPKLAKPIVSHCRLMLCVISTMFFVTSNSADCL
uniref:DNA damage-regulated autophagy modulator protein 2 n=1 Tax=Parascaris univalens TaxID=6257 RepID=A0A914ZTJ5_PARUN